MQHREPVARRLFELTEPISLVNLHSSSISSISVSLKTVVFVVT